MFCQDCAGPRIGVGVTGSLDNPTNTCNFLSPEFCKGVARESRTATTGADTLRDVPVRVPTGPGCSAATDALEPGHPGTEDIQSFLKIHTKATNDSQLRTFGCANLPAKPDRTVRSDSESQDDGAADEGCDDNHEPGNNTEEDGSGRKKTCNLCEQLLSLCCFRRATSGRIESYCTPCSRVVQRGRTRGLGINVLRAALQAGTLKHLMHGIGGVPAGQKICRLCEDVKDVNCFKIASRGGRESYCISCNKLVRRGVKKGLHIDAVRFAFKNGSIYELLRLDNSASREPCAEGFKRCNLCSVAQSLDAFCATANGRTSYCRPCERLVQRGRSRGLHIRELREALHNGTLERVQSRIRPGDAVLPEGMKACNLCEEALPLEAFKIKYDGTMCSYCEPCSRLVGRGRRRSLSMGTMRAAFKDGTLQRLLEEHVATTLCDRLPRPPKWPTKNCNLCLHEFAIDMFRVVSGGGRCSYCCPCERLVGTGRRRGVPIARLRTAYQKRTLERILGIRVTYVDANGAAAKLPASCAHIFADGGETEGRADSDAHVDPCSGVSTSSDACRPQADPRQGRIMRGTIERSSVGPHTEDPARASLTRCPQRRRPLVPLAPPGFAPAKPAEADGGLALLAAAATTPGGLEQLSAALEGTPIESQCSEVSRKRLCPGLNASLSSRACGPSGTTKQVSEATTDIAGMISQQWLEGNVMHRGVGSAAEQPDKLRLHPGAVLDLVGGDEEGERAGVTGQERFVHTGEDCIGQGCRDTQLDMLSSPLVAAAIAAHLGFVPPSSSGASQLTAHTPTSPTDEVVETPNLWGHSCAGPFMGTLQGRHEPVPVPQDELVKALSALLYLLKHLDMQSPSEGFFTPEVFLPLATCVLSSAVSKLVASEPQGWAPSMPGVSCPLPAMNKCGTTRWDGLRNKAPSLSLSTEMHALAQTLHPPKQVFGDDPCVSVPALSAPAERWCDDCPPRAHVASAASAMSALEHGSARCPTEAPSGVQRTLHHCASCGRRCEGNECMALDENASGKVACYGCVADQLFRLAGLQSNAVGMQ